jgi:hypothetical protein
MPFTIEHTLSLLEERYTTYQIVHRTAGKEETDPLAPITDEDIEKTLIQIEQPYQKRAREMLPEMIQNCHKSGQAWSFPFFTVYGISYSQNSSIKELYPGIDKEDLGMPDFHFNHEFNHINDPNGLVLVNESLLGEYGLFLRTFSHPEHSSPLAISTLRKEYMNQTIHTRERRVKIDKDSPEAIVEATYEAYVLLMQF